jgi:peptidoglycan/xylan/chitin deacetylase (PgdA/CDA1 family)
LPFVYLGLSKDFWSKFQEYASVENGSKSTFFIIPFKNRPGDNVTRVTQEPQKRRMARYDITDVQETVQDLAGRGFEIGVHGIDAWHDLELARQERDRIARFAPGSNLGIRMHWLCFSDESFKILDQAGYAYDASFGYNGAVGYRAGTCQVFRPIGAVKLLELPLHVQDTTLFFARQLNLSERQAWDLCAKLLKHARAHGGVLTIGWHDRSLAPERLWGDFYIRLLETLKESGAWFATAGEAVAWFKKRRAVSFSLAEQIGNNLSIGLKVNNATDWQGGGPSLMVRFHLPQRKPSQEYTPSASHTHHLDVEWSGQSIMTVPIE